MALNIRLNLCLFVVLTVFVLQVVCIWPWSWENKPRPVDGNWSPWSTWSSCRIPSKSDTLPFRYKQRNCSNPSPKNGGADCEGESRRTSSCDDCNIPLGLESGRIQDSFMSALNSHPEFPASAARLNGKSAWCSDNPDSLLEPLYLEIELKKLTAVSAIATQGFYPAAEIMSLRMGRVSKYQLMYSTDGVSWQIYKNNDNETLPGNKKRNGTMLNVLTPEITARFIRVYPVSYFSFVCMRVELYGCTFSCGESLGQEPGNIVTEGTPTEDQDCLWFVNLPNTTKLHFDFINFNIPCSNGYTELRAGEMPYSVAPVLALYCGYDSPPPLVTSDSGKLWVRYKSNASDPQVGFYSVYFPGCGAHLQGSSGKIMSPNFPKEYFHNSKCIWTITVPDGKLVQLRFVEFKVEGDRNRHRCPHDHLTVWNGSDSSAPLIGKYCNSNPPPPIICSSGSTLRLKFRSDDALAWTGFHISYRAVDPLTPCSEMSSSVIMPTSSRPMTTSNMALTLTPLLTQHALFPSSNYLVTATAITAIQASPSMALNGTVGFIGTLADGEMQAAARGKKDDDDDDDGLITLIILSVFSFVVVCMIIASVVPGLKHHFEKQKREKEMLLMLAASVSIPETNSKETFEVVPIIVDDSASPVLESIACEAMSYEGSQLLPVETAESLSVSETPTELNNEQSDGVESEVPNANEANSDDDKLAEENTDELDHDSENGRAEQDTNMPSDFEDDKVEVGSLKLSYEDLGSSFASEMQAMLSHFVEDGDEPVWNASPSANPENSPQDSEHGAERTAINDLEAGNSTVPCSFLSTQDDSNSIPPSEEPLASNGSLNQEGKLEHLPNSDDADTRQLWEMQPDHINTHGRRKTAGEDRVSVSCTDSKDSGCASSSENLHLVENYLYPGDNETSV